MLFSTFFYLKIDIFRKKVINKNKEGVIILRAIINLIILLSMSIYYVFMFLVILIEYGLFLMICSMVILNDYSYLHVYIVPVVITTVFFFALITFRKKDMIKVYNFIMFKFGFRPPLGGALIVLGFFLLVNMGIYRILGDIKESSLIITMLISVLLAMPINEKLKNKYNHYLIKEKEDLLKEQ